MSSIFSCFRICNKQTSENGELVLVEPTTRRHTLRSVQIVGHSTMGNNLNLGLQDGYCIVKDISKDMHFFGVYDGHGPLGNEYQSHVADYTEGILKGNKKKIESMTAKEVVEALGDYLTKIETAMKESSDEYENSGACALTVLMQRDRIFLTHIGNCRALIGGQPNLENPYRQVTVEHVPSFMPERERVQKEGASLMKIKDKKGIGLDRVWKDTNGPGLGLTRCLGHFGAKDLLISKPEIEKIDLKPEDQFLILGTDGLWSVMSNDEVWRMVLQAKDRNKIAEELVEEAKKRWDKSGEKVGLEVADFVGNEAITDDITALVAYFYYDVEDEVKLKSGR